MVELQMDLSGHALFFLQPWIVARNASTGGGLRRYTTLLPVLKWAPQF
jgi:hypothetical protein